MPRLKREADCYPADLFVAGGDPGPWWVAHVRSRQEKGLARHLLDEGVPFFLPQEERQVRRDGRLRVSYLPLFPGYVFCRGAAAERLAALRSHVVVRHLPVRDQAGLHAELAAIWRLQTAGELLVPHPYLGPGDEVEVARGPLQGLRGTVVRDAGPCRFVVSVTFLRRAVAAVLDRDDLVPADERPAGTHIRAAR